MLKAEVKGLSGAYHREQVNVAPSRTLGLDEEFLNVSLQLRDRHREAIHLRGQTVEPPKAAGGGRPKDFTKKAVLLSGPPGIGKTSSALIVAR